MNENLKREIDSSEIELLNIGIKRTVTGAKLNLKSKIFEDFFNRRILSDDETIRNRDGSIIKYYTSPNFSDREIQRKITQCDTTLRNGDGYINAGFLRIAGLSNGITIDINGVYNKTALMGYINDMKMFARDFYLEYMCENDIQVEIVIKGNDK